MFAARQRLVLLLIAGLCLDAYGAPVEEEQEETNPELTAGYFEGDMIVDFLPNATDEASSDVGQQEETNPELTAGYFQGDMDVKFQRNGLIAPTKHWPRGIVYYKIDKAFNTEQTKYIKLAMQRIQLESCIRFVLAKPKTLNYVLITGLKSGCFSNVGYQGGVQTLNLQRGRPKTACIVLGIIEHELLHTLGFFHQQSSSDRDKYVKIIKENIKDKFVSNFAKYGPKKVDNFGATYDYNSVMHYAPTDFTWNGNPTIVALQPDGQSKMGQRVALSIADIKRLNNMYKCPSQ